MNLGLWSSAFSYSTGDTVIGMDGNIYRAIRNNRGVDPAIFNDAWVEVGHQRPADPSSLLTGHIHTPRFGYGWNGGIAAEQFNGGQSLTVPANTNAPIYFDTFYSPGVGDAAGYEVLEDDFMQGSLYYVNIKKSGWYQVSASVSFNDPLTTDGTLGIAGTLNGAYSYLPIGIMSMTINPYTDYIREDSDIFFGIVAGLQDMNNTLSYANVAFVPLFNLED